MNSYQNLEFNKVKELLSEFALTRAGKEKALKLEPFFKEVECKSRMDETTQGRKSLDTIGNPPLPIMDNFGEIIAIVKAGGMLIPEQLSSIERFLLSSKQMISYLKKAETLGISIAYYGNYIEDIAVLREEISQSIRNNAVDDNASSELKNIRRKSDNLNASIKDKLNALLRNNKNWFADGYITTRQGRLVVPVKKEFKNQVSGSVVEISNTGGTYFIEPTSTRKLKDEINQLEILEENEVVKILYTLTAAVEDHLSQIERNMLNLEALDFIFAKAKLSASMWANPVTIATNKTVEIIDGRHPFIHRDSCVPLNFHVNRNISGVIITGANTGGKTVALKTIGLLSLMAQSGLHLPASENSVLSMFSNVLCDIGDGQSITENLSTFSAHIKSVIEVLKNTTEESLVLLDELGSGTDPAEGMGLAIAILDELLAKKCFFVATTHYPEVKDYAETTEKVINARMAFDRESLKPLYQLQIGQSGESCAFYIAQNLGLPAHMLKRAHKATYKEDMEYESAVVADNSYRVKLPKIIKETPPAEKTALKPSFNLGDSVQILPQKEAGIVFSPTDKMGMVGVQVKKEKLFLNHKRIKLIMPAAELYPEGYDFSIIFDTVANRKARHQMDKKHSPDLVVTSFQGNND